MSKEIPSLKISTSEPFSATPRNRGVASLVTLSESEVPVSETDASSGADGIVGAISSRSLIDRDTANSEEFCAESVATTVKENDDFVS